MNPIAPDHLTTPVADEVTSRSHHFPIAADELMVRAPRLSHPFLHTSPGLKARPVTARPAGPGNPPINPPTPETAPFSAPPTHTAPSLAPKLPGLKSQRRPHAPSRPLHPLLPTPGLKARPVTARPAGPGNPPANPSSPERAPFFA